MPENERAMLNTSTILVISSILLRSIVANENNDTENVVRRSGEGFLFSMPKILISGQNETVCLTLHGGGLPAKTIIDLKWKERHFLTVRNFDTDHTCFDLFIPLLEIKEPHFVGVKIQVQLNGVVQSAHNLDPIVVYPKKVVKTFVNTDKSVYKPGDKVRFRVLVIDEKLLPQNAKISEIKLKNPSDVTVAVWEDLAPENGLLTLDHQLPSESITGKWKIEVLDTQKIFEVYKYVLPRFKLNLTHPKSVFYKTDSLNITVCGRYPYGRNVKGLAFVKITDSHSRMKPLHKLKEMVNGCADFTVPPDEMSLGTLKEKFPNYDPKMSLYVTATVTEKGTNRIDVSTGKIPIIFRPYALKFLYNPIFQPGVPFRGKLKLLNVNVPDVDGEVFRVCYNMAVKRSWNYLNEEHCSNLMVEGGERVVDFSVLPVKSNIIHMNFNARSLNHTDVGDSFLTVRLFSHSNSYISLQQAYVEKDKNECRAPQQFKVLFTADKFEDNDNITFYYMIKSLSRIYKQRKIVHYVRKSTPDYERELKNLIGGPHKFTKFGTVVDSFNIKFRLDRRVVSKYQLLVYYVTDAGETVSITRNIEVEPCLMKVSARWNQKQMVPGATASLNIETGTHSLCSVSAVDKSTRFISSGSNGNNNFDFATLVKSFSSEEREPPQSGRKSCVTPVRRHNNQSPGNLHESDVDSNSPWDLRRRRRRRRHVYSFSEDFDSYDMFDKFGTVVITNLKVVTKPCYTGPLTKDTNQVQFLTDYDVHNEEPAVSIRSHFPETWLWELIPVSNSIQLNRHLPHTITNWVTNVLCMSEEEGLGISPEFEITSFQSFFVEVLTPNTVKRDEAFYLTVHVSNHMEQTFPVRIILRLSEGVELKNPQDKLTVSYCLKGNNSVTYILQVRATTVGTVNVTVLAEIDSQYPEECGPETLLSKRDVVLKQILVESEGYPMKTFRSALLCASDSGDGNNVTWHLKTPPDVIAGTNKTLINLNGDLLGNTIENLEELLDVPTGCGEQIMATVAPNLYVLRYLNASNLLKHYTRQRIVRNLKIGYQRILNYVHKDGSFSAFGYHDATGSMFLTAFVMRVLKEAKRYIYVDQNVIDKAAGWIYEHQLENGCFNTMLHVFQDMGGTSKENSTSSLTAYVMLSLLESEMEVPETVRSNAKYCIRSAQNMDKYTSALTCYVLFKMNWRDEAEKLLTKLLAVAERQNDMLWWTNKANESSASDIEITSYVLLALLHDNSTENMANARWVVRWLSSKYGPKGGFKSTQDTVVALEALARYSEMIRSRYLNVSVAVHAGDVREGWTVTNADKMKSKAIVLDGYGDEDKINVSIDGEGCVLAQVVHSYYLKNVPKAEAFRLAVEISPVSTIAQCSIANFSPCLSYNGPDGFSNMAVMEIALPSGYEADRASLYRLVESESTSKIKMFEEQDDKINLYFTKLDKQLICFDFNINEFNMVEFRKDSLIKLYDYYNPEYEVLQYYQISDKCGDVNGSQIPGLVESQLKTTIRIDNVTIELEDRSEEKVDPVSPNEDDNRNETSVKVTKREIYTLNPEFVDKSYEMEMPDTMEANQPVYMKPDPDFKPDTPPPDNK